MGRIHQMAMRLAFIASNLLFTAQAQKSDLTLAQIANENSPSILQLDYWAQDAGNLQGFNVDGTGFLVGQDGYFVSAGHVLARYKPDSGQLTAAIHQKDKSGSGLWFDIVEKDIKHDLALL